MNWVFPLSSDPAHAVITAPFGKLGITVMGDGVHSIEFLDETTPDQASSAAFLTQVISQLQAYFRDPAWQFTVPLVTQGTSYRQRIWQELMQIKAGQVRTYAALAGQLSSGARAVGSACRANPLPIIIPCHRVVAAKGLGGFAGDTSGKRIEIKRWLLGHEGVVL